MFGLPTWVIYGAAIVLGEVATVTARNTENRKGFGWELLHSLSKLVASLPTFSGPVTKAQMKKKLR